MTIVEALEQFLGKTGVVAAAAADVESGRVWFAGDTDREDFSWLVRETFASPGAVRTACAYLAGKKLPQLSAQGSARAALTRSEGLLLAAFFVRDASMTALAGYERAESLAAALTSSVEGASRE